MPRADFRLLSLVPGCRSTCPDGAEAPTFMYGPVPSLLGYRGIVRTSTRLRSTFQRYPRKTHQDRHHEITGISRCMNLVRRGGCAPAAWSGGS